MAKEYIIQCRYEWRSFNGVVWTDWFVSDSTRYSEDSIKVALKREKDNSKNTDKVTKLNHEYRAYDADLYDEEYKQLLINIEKAKEEFAKIPRMKKPWKRKKKKIEKI